MTKPTPTKLAEDEETRLLLQISDLQQHLSLAHKTLSWIMYESLMLINASYPLSVLLGDNTEEKEFIKSKIDNLDSKSGLKTLLLTNALCYRDTTAAATFAALEIFKAHELPDGHLSSEGARKNANTLLHLFKARYTSADGQLIGSAVSLSNTSIYGHKLGDPI